MTGSTNPKDMLASLLGTHMQIEALGLCAAMDNISKFAEFYLDGDEAPAVNVTFQAVVEFVVLCTAQAMRAHLGLSAGVLGINVSEDSEFFKRTLEEAAGQRGYLLAVIFNQAGLKDKEVDYYMNQRGPLSKFMQKED